MNLNKLVLGTVMLSSTLMAGCSCSEQVEKLNSDIKTLNSKFESKFEQINNEVNTIHTDLQSAHADLQLAKEEAARANLRLNNQASSFHK